MDNEILKILNEELIELKRMSNLAQQRLDLQREDLNRHAKMFDKHEATLASHQAMLNNQQEAFKLLFAQMQKMDEKLDNDLRRLRGEK